MYSHSYTKQELHSPAHRDMSQIRQMCSPQTACRFEVRLRAGTYQFLHSGLGRFDSRLGASYIFSQQVSRPIRIYFNLAPPLLFLSTNPVSPLKTFKSRLWNPSGWLAPLHVSHQPSLYRSHQNKTTPKKENSQIIIIPTNTRTSRNTCPRLPVTRVINMHPHNPFRRRVVIQNVWSF